MVFQPMTLAEPQLNPSASTTSPHWILLAHITKMHKYNTADYCSRSAVLPEQIAANLFQPNIDGVRVRPP